MNMALLICAQRWFRSSKQIKTCEASLISFIKWCNFSCVPEDGKRDLDVVTRSLQVNGFEGDAGVGTGTSQNFTWHRGWILEMSSKSTCITIKLQLPHL